MTREQRIDEKIEVCLVAWLDRIRRQFYEPHNRPSARYEEREAHEIKAGEWIYHAPSVPRAQCTGYCQFVMGRERYGALPGTKFLVKVGYAAGPPCQCEPCLIYRTCCLPTSEVA